MSATDARAAVVRAARTLDARLVAPGPAGRLRQLYTLVAAVVAWRLLTRDWTAIADRPTALRFRLNAVGWIPDLPAWALVTLQVVGVVAALLAIARVRPRLALTVAGVAYVVLCGLWGSSGKFMHNDVLTVSVVAVLLLARLPGRDVAPDDRSVRWGWPPRAALAVVGVVYLLTGAQKLRSSGLSWAFSDNMEWVLLQGRLASPIGADAVVALAGTPLVPQALAAGALTLELLAPLLLLVRRTRLLFGLAVAVMHGSIWLCLGIDYTAWVLTVAAVVIPTGLPLHRRAPAAEPRAGHVTPEASAAPPAPSTSR